MRRMEEQVRAAAAGQGLVFGVGGEQRPFPIDGFPRVISTHDWNTLASGLTQRARALESYLRDAYGEARIVRDRAVAPDILTACSAWRPEARFLPDDVVRAPVMGFDLVRDDLGWRVLEDNVRVPSGIAYAIAIAGLLRTGEPQLTSRVPLRDPEDVPALIRSTLQACSDAEDPVVRLLSEGAQKYAWF